MAGPFSRCLRVWLVTSSPLMSASSRQRKRKKHRRASTKDRAPPGRGGHSQGGGGASKRRGRRRQLGKGHHLRWKGAASEGGYHQQARGPQEREGATPARGRSGKGEGVTLPGKEVVRRGDVVGSRAGQSTKVPSGGQNRLLTARLPKIPHSNSSERVPNRPLRPRRGRFGKLWSSCSEGLFGERLYIQPFSQKSLTATIPTNRPTESL